MESANPGDIWLDEEALKQLMATHSRLIWRVLRARLDDEAKVDDAASQVWIVAARRIQSGPSGSLVLRGHSEHMNLDQQRAMLVKIAENVVRNSRRSQRRFHRLLATLLPALPTSLADYHSMQVRAIDDEIVLELVRNELPALSKKARILFEAHFLEGLSIKQLAEQHDWTRRSVSSCVSAAKRTIVERVRGKMDQDPIL